MTGPIALQTRRIALAFEIEGERSDAPTVYIIAGGKITPQSDKGTDKRYVSGNRQPVLPIRKPESFKLSIPMFAILESNGLGELMLATFGSDVISSQLGSSGAYDHVFTMTDTPLTMTVWCWDTLDPQDIRMVVIDSMKIEVNKEKNEILFTFDCVGADMASSATFGSASYIDTSTHKPNVIPASQALLGFGEPAANIRNAWESVVFQIKNNAKFGAPGKKAPIPSGSSSPRLVTWSNQDITIDIEFIDQDGKELKRWRQGGDTAPTATAQTDTQALTKFRLRAFGSAIGTTSIWGYSDLNNAGAATVTWGGTYSGTGPDMFEVKITTDGTPDKFMWRKNGGAWSAEVSVTGTAQTLSDGVTVTFSSTSTSTLGDRHYGFSHYQRMISIESLYNVIEKVGPKDSDDFYRGIINMYHSSGPSATKPTVTIRNTRVTAYDRVEGIVSDYGLDFSDGSNSQYIPVIWG